MSRKPTSTPGAPEPCRLEREELALRFWETIPATTTAVDKVVNRILEVAESMECAKGELEKVQLALQEALNNAILHGSGGDPTKQVIVCCLCSEEKGMLLVVRDFGPGFDPSQVPNPTRAENIYSTHGRGIFLMRQLMDEVEFRKGGRQVMMSKRPRHRGRPRS